MQNKEAIKSKLPLKDRTWFKLFLLFVGGFLATFIFGFVLDIFTSGAESQLATTNLMAQPNTIAIDPKLESELAKVLNFETPQGVSQTRDPFTDRNNLSGDNKAIAALAPVTNNQAVAAKTAANQPKPATPQKNMGGQAALAKNNQPQTNTVAAPPVNYASKEATIERIRLRENRLREGKEAGPLSSIFAMNDLFPIGTVSGGDGQEEVMFFSQSINQTISFPVGSRFFDGWLVGYRPDGVELNPYGQNTTHVKGWGKETRDQLNDFSLTVPMQTQPE